MKRITYFAVLIFISHQNFAQQFLMVRDGKYGKYGWIDKTKAMTVDYIYDDANAFSEGLAAVALYDKNNTRYNWGYIDEKGQVVVPLVYQQVKGFTNGFAAIMQNGKHGFINKKGEPVVPIKYDDSNYDLSGGRAALKLKNKWRLVDSTGKELVIIKSEYKQIGWFHEGMCVVTNENGLQGYIDINGNEIIPCKYQLCSYFKNNIAQVGIDTVISISKTRRYGLIDRTGKELTQMKYHDIKPFKNGFARAEVKVGINNDRINVTYINEQGKEVLAPGNESTNIWFDKWIYTKDHSGEKLFDIAGRLVSSKGNPSVKRIPEGYLCRFNEKYGLLDTTGKEMISFVYDDMGSFSNGLSRVKTGNKYGYVNVNGQLVIPAHYDEAGDFYQGAAKVKQGEKEYILEPDGELTLLYKDPNDIKLTGPEGFRYGKKLDGKWLLSVLNEKKVNLEYDSITLVNSELFLAFKETQVIIYEKVNTKIRNITTEKSILESVQTYTNQGAHHLIGITYVNGMYGLYFFDWKEKLRPFTYNSRYDKTTSKHEFFLVGDWWDIGSFTRSGEYITELKKQCISCKGKGKMPDEIKRIEIKGEWVPEKTTYTPTTSTSSERTWDPNTNQYKDVRTKVSGSTSKTTPGYRKPSTYKEEIIPGKICTQCKGRKHIIKKIKWSGSEYVEVK